MSNEVMKPVAFRYRYEPGLQWHVAQWEDQLPTRDRFPHSQVEPLYSALQPSPAARDRGKMVKPSADATHCGGYPVNPPAREEAEALVAWLRKVSDHDDTPTKNLALAKSAAFIARTTAAEKEVHKFAEIADANRRRAEAAEKELSQLREDFRTLAAMYKLETGDHG